MTAQNVIVKQRIHTTMFAQDVAEAKADLRKKGLMMEY